MYLNPNLFGATTFNSLDEEALINILRDSNLFAYRSDNQLSYTKRFEIALHSYLGNETYACAVMNGTAGLRTALHICKVKPGDYVGVSSYTFIATANAVLSVGAWPVPIDIDSRLGMDLEDLTRKAEQLVGVITVYVAGQSSNVAEVKRIMEQQRKFVIEDACQGFGASTDGIPAGTIGNVGVYSFQQNKQITSGEGGAIVSRDIGLLESARQYIDHGSIRNDDGIPSWDDPKATVGENLRITELQAALLTIQLSRLEQMLMQQRAARNSARKCVAEWPISIVQSYDTIGDTAGNLLMLASSPEQAQAIIDIAARSHILLRFIWKKPFYANLSIKRVYASQSYLHELTCPQADELSQRLLALPIPPLLCGERLQQFEDALVKLQIPY